MKVLSWQSVGQIHNFSIFLYVYKVPNKTGIVPLSTAIYLIFLQFQGILHSLQDEKLSLHFLIF